MHFKPILVACTLLLAVAVAAAAEVPVPSPRWLRDPWPASWITAPSAPKSEYGVWLFRKQLELARQPGRFVVHVTGDARYRLFVNGESVVFGPQRSDAWQWHYETVDLAPWLRPGTNVIAAEVVAYGDLSPYAVVGVRTGFLLQGDSAEESGANTDDTWRVTRDTARTALPVVLPTYIVVGPGEHIDGQLTPWGWQTVGFDAQAWEKPRVLARGMPLGSGTDIEHALTPRTLPPMEESVVRFARVRRAEGLASTEGFVSGTAPLTVPPNSRATLLLDQGVETNAFPQLVVSGGRGSTVKLTYAEALVDANGQKGQRDDVGDRTIMGVVDEIRPDGGDHRNFSTQSFRTYRYVQMEMATAGEALRVDDLHGVFTAYPFSERGAFSSDDPELARLWTVGWRTARLCAFETYVDCPYYEQLQYVGDARIQALISLYVSGDDRLMRNAIMLFDRSRVAEGLTQSRYPSTTPQLINTFSLWWIDMVHDYWMHRADDGFVRARLPGMEAVLGWFEGRIDTATGLLGPLAYWTFVDWTDEWPWDDARGTGGEPEGAREGGSSIVALQLAGTLRRSAELCRAFERGDLAARYNRLAAKLCRAVTERCWDARRGLFADSPAKQQFSQHANSLAVLAGAISGDEATAVMRRVVTDETLVQCSTYFRFYLLRAMKAAGLGDEYVNQLGPWRTMLDRGLTTFAERPDPTRSDCHAWSASPVYELLATVAGIEPASPGFASVKIAPHLGALQRVDAIVPHPNGEIKVSYRRNGDGLEATVALPAGVDGTLEWNGKTIPLRAGAQAVRAD